jgi:hypothetical protein
MVYDMAMQHPVAGVIAMPHIIPLPIMWCIII